MKIDDIKKIVGTEINTDGPWAFTAEKLDDFLLSAIMPVLEKAKYRLNYGDIPDRKYVMGTVDTVDYIIRQLKEN